MLLMVDSGALAAGTNSSTAQMVCVTNIRRVASRRAVRIEWRQAAGRRAVAAAINEAAERLRRPLPRASAAGHRRVLGVGKQIFRGPPLLWGLPFIFPLSAGGSPGAAAARLRQPQLQPCSASSCASAQGLAWRQRMGPQPTPKSKLQAGSATQSFPASWATAQSMRSRQLQAKAKASSGEAAAAAAAIAIALAMNSKMKHTAVEIGRAHV